MLSVQWEAFHQIYNGLSSVNKQRLSTNMVVMDNTLCDVVTNLNKLNTRLKSTTCRLIPALIKNSNYSISITTEQLQMCYTELLKILTKTKNAPKYASIKPLTNMPQEITNMLPTKFRKYTMYSNDPTFATSKYYRNRQEPTMLHGFRIGTYFLRPWQAHLEDLTGTFG